jgi:hypothetical protein
MLSLQERSELPDSNFIVRFPTPRIERRGFLGVALDLVNTKFVSSDNAISLVPSPGSVGKAPFVPNQKNWMLFTPKRLQKRRFKVSLYRERPQAD